MNDPQITRPSLLLRIRDPQDAEAWREFAAIYTPTIYRYARRRGLQDADAAVVTQDVLQTVARRIGNFEYDPARGSFRGWLMSVTRSRFNDFLERERRSVRGTGDTDAKQQLEQQPADEKEAAVWEREYRRSLFEWAASRVRSRFRETTWQAFWRTAVDGEEVEQVANDLGISPGAVYIARSRALARLRQAVREIEDRGP